MSSRRPYDTRRKKSRLWSRNEITICFCIQLSYRHVHCPCLSCCGRPVSSSIERRHWNNLKTWLENNERVEREEDGVSQHQDDDSNSEDKSNHESDSDTVDGNERSSNDDLLTLNNNADVDDCNNNNEGTSDDDDSDVDNDESEVDTDCAAEDHETEDDSDSDPERLIVNAVIEAFTINDSINGSHESLMEILKFGRKLYEIGSKKELHNWPRTYHKAMKLLENVGYSTPEFYWTCMSATHPTNVFNYDVAQEICQVCNETLTIPVYHSSLSKKVRSWCNNEKMCNKMLAHWNERDHWMRENVGEPYYPIREVWDGTRFCELSWFWDANQEWTLPIKCENCSEVISADSIMNAPVHLNSSKKVICKSCGSEQIITEKKVTGDPRNIAFLLHWDGFQPARNAGSRSSGAVEVSVLNMHKKERSKLEEIYVLTFVPVHLLPHQRPNLLDAYLQPIVSELENLFIDGVDVDYAVEVAGLQPGKATIRCCILACTGDYPAQCEVGKFINGGIHACRRDHLEGVRINNTSTHYYLENRKRNRFPWERRNLEIDAHLIEEIENEDRPSIRTKLSKDSGYTGKSLLSRLSNLTGFNVCTDLVLDMMHNIPMNVVKKFLCHLVDSGELNAEEVDERLKNTIWNFDFKSGRIPNGFSTRRNRWTAEEYQKFMFPLAEVIIGDLVSDKYFHLLQLLSRITEMVYNFRGGWTQDAHSLFEKIVKRFVILSEEWIGKSFCVITTHNLLHIHEDIKRFGLPDNYWCWPFERCVKKYKSRSSNMKNVEKSFLLAESRREVLQFYRKSYDSIGGTNIQEVSASSIKNTNFICDSLKDCRSVLVGALHSNFKALSLDDFQLLCNLVRPVQLNNNFHCFRSLLLRSPGDERKLFREGEFVLMQRNNVTYLARLDFFTNIPLQLEFHVVLCDLFHPDSSDPYSGHIFYNYASDERCALAAVDILRKVMVWETIDGKYLAIDYERITLPIKSTDIQVPLYVVLDDIVQIECQDGLWYALVAGINYDLKYVDVYYFQRRHGQQNCLDRCRYPRDRIQLDCVREICDGTLNVNRTKLFLA